MAVYFKLIRNRNFVLRENTLDEYVAKENSYHNVSFSQEDIWLDVGGNIGVFPVNCFEKVSHIHTFEPDEANLDMLNKNLKLNNIQNCSVYNTAVVWDDRETTDFYINVKKNKGAHSMLVQHGREHITVPCTNINTVLSMLTPNKIKMDVEGVEYELIKAIKNWGGIEEFIFEYHIAILRDHAGTKLRELYDILSKYFTITGRSPDSLKKNWVTIVHCVCIK
jgi:FkbM family methyltransferase